MHRTLAFNDRSIGVFLIFLGVTFDHRNTFNDGPRLFREQFKYLAGLTLVGTRDNDYLVASFNVKFLHGFNVGSFAGASLVRVAIEPRGRAR